MALHSMTSFHSGRFLFCVILVVVSWDVVSGHGRLVKPPGRSTMWRNGYRTPPNYNDHQLFCGGFPVQWWVNGGRCGICGDRWDLPVHDNEPPYGKYANGIITGHYQQGGTISINVQVTASHKGYFEFRLCPNNNVKVPATQACLDRYLLQDLHGNGTKVYVDDSSVGFYDIKMKLPDDVTCSQCVLQWRYRSGNRWGCHNNDFSKGPCGLGYGPQEEFYACADIAILRNDGNDFQNETSTPAPTTQFPQLPKVTTTVPPSPTTSTTPRPITRTPPPTVKVVCKAAGPWKGYLPMDNWCDINCKRRYCPITHCKCSPAGQLVDSNGLLGTGKDCFSVAGHPGLDLWCKHNCPQGLCDQNTCYCV